LHDHELGFAFRAARAGCVRLFGILRCGPAAGHGLGYAACGICDGVRFEPNSGCTAGFQSQASSAATSPGNGRSSAVGTPPLAVSDGIVAGFVPRPAMVPERSTNKLGITTGMQVVHEPLTPAAVRRVLLDTDEDGSIAPMARPLYAHTTLP
jgi:hypothetical protein